MESKVDQVVAYIKDKFYEEYLEGLRESVRIPSLNPDYDPEWLANGNLFKQCQHMAQFAKS